MIKNPTFSSSEILVPTRRSILIALHSKNLLIEINNLKERNGIFESYLLDPKAPRW